MIIYKSTNIINGMVYIGRTKHTLSERKSQHKHNAFKKNEETYFCRAIRKYGWDNFSWEVLEECDSETHLSQREVYWISKYESFNRDNGYNMTIGGEGNSHFGEMNPMYGKSHSEETKMKISNSKKGFRHSEDRKKAISESVKGEKHPLARLTEDDVREIRKMLKSNTMTQKEIANLFNVKPVTICAINTKRIWKHVE